MNESHALERGFHLKLQIEKTRTNNMTNRRKERCAIVVADGTAGHDKPQG